jgi:hypothetical protein
MISFHAAPAEGFPGNLTHFLIGTSLVSRELHRWKIAKALFCDSSS